MATLAINTMSYPTFILPSIFNLYDSFILLLILFLLIAFPTFLETEIPTLVESDLLSSIYITKFLFAKDLPCLYTFLKSESFFKPWVLLKSILKPP